MPGRLPIVYVRGFAGDTRSINQAVDDPFYGFNLGSTHVRVAGDGSPIFYQFESPLLRLMSEMGYQLHVDGGQEAYLDRQPDGGVAEATVWIHRFYDAAATTWSPGGRESRPFQLEDAAADLFGLVGKVLRKTGANRVHLVAHSMGGLICRSMIQRVIPDLQLRAADFPDRQLRAADFVDRLFTYATPHGGIEFDFGFGILEAVRDEFGIGGAEIFGPERMYSYLTASSERKDRVPGDWDARVNPDEHNFPLDRIFCLIGTNAEDYEVALGLPARAVGTKSDGLVQIENALVSDEGKVAANHAYVHRSHSGRYGIVNSEEGYQNLVRFLFGDVKVTADLVDLQLPRADELTWQAETQVAVRGLPVLMHEQTAAHHCPVLIEEDRPEEAADRPVPLVTSYLWTEKARPHRGGGAMRYTVHVRLLSLRERNRMFLWDDHTEQTTDFDDTLVIDVEQRDAGLVAWANWASQIPVPLRDYVPEEGSRLTDADPQDGAWLARVPLPEAGRFLGANAAVTLTLRPVG